MSGKVALILSKIRKKNPKVKISKVKCYRLQNLRHEGVLSQTKKVTIIPYEHVNNKNTKIILRFLPL